MASRIVSSNPWPQRTSSHASPKSTPFPYSDETQHHQIPLDDEDYSGHDSNSYDHKVYRSTHLNKRSPPSRRQIADPATVTSDSCGLVGNNVITCFPDADSIVIQNIPSRIVWNTNLPNFAQTNSIDVHLIHGDTDVPVLTWLAQQYQSGHLAFIPNDTWWGSKGPEIQQGENQTQSFFFVLVPNGVDTLVGTPQATFTATQTSLPTSILASISSVASASSVSASLASLSSASLASLASSTSKPTTSSSSPTSASLQGNSSGSNSFPNWAIALLSVFGFLAFLSLLCVLFLLFRGLKRKDRGGLYERASTGGELKYRGSVGSNTPMIPRTTPGAEAAFKEGPSVGAGALPVGGAEATSPAPPTSGGVTTHPMSDNGSTISHADSAYAAGAPPMSHTAAHPPPFSLTDAAALGFAFRNVMRKPDFPDVDEGDGDNPGLRQSVADDDAGREVLESELAEEGRDIRSVSSSRGVKIETVDSSTA